MFGRKLTDEELRVAATITGRKLDADRRSSMPLDGVLFAEGGDVTDTRLLGVMQGRCFTGAEATQALELNRPPIIHTPPRQSTTGCRRRLDERLRALGIQV